MADAIAKPAGAPVWIELGARDPGAASRFYGDVLGVDAGEPIEGFGGYRMLTLRGDAVAGVMGVQAADPSGWLVYLSAPDLDAVVAAVPEHGGVVLSPPQQVGDLGRMAVISDPSGATTGLWEAGSFAGGEAEGVAGAPSWYELHVGEHYDETVAFYERAIGWGAVVVADTDGFRMATYGDASDAWAGIFDAAAGDSRGWRVYFAVADADDVSSRVADGGGTLLREPQDTPYGRFFDALDPEGARFSAMTRPDRSAAVEGD